MLTLNDDIDIIFECIACMLEGAAVTFFPEFLGKCRFCALLNEVAQKFVCKIRIIRNNSDIVLVYIAL